MLTKEQFRKRVKDYCDFQKYQDKLYKLSINTYEIGILGRLLDTYVDMLYESMNVKYDTDESYKLDELLYGNYDFCTDEDIDEVYHEIMSSKRYVPEQPKKEEPKKLAKEVEDWYRTWVRINFGDFLND